MLLEHSQLFWFGFGSGRGFTSQSTIFLVMSGRTRYSGFDHVRFEYVCSISRLKSALNTKDNMSTLCLPVSSADNLGIQFGPRSGPTNRRA